MSCFVQYAPYKTGPRPALDTEKEKFGDTVIKTLAEHAPTSKDIILNRQIVTPLDLESRVGIEAKAISSRANVDA